MPPLSEEKYASPREDIARQSVLVPIEVDENGTVLDGHHRLRACEELGLAPPILILPCLTDEEKRAHGLPLNLARRHLTSQQKRELVRAELRRDPDRSDREIGRLLRVSHPTRRERPPGPRGAKFFQGH